MIRTNCINCGAPLKNGKCEYCGTEYHLDSLGQVKEYKVKVNIMGQEKDFYIGKIEKHSIFGDSHRDVSGNLITNKICDKLRLELIEM